MSHSTISLGLGLGGGKAATSSGAPSGGGAAFANTLSGLFDDDFLSYTNVVLSGARSVSLWIKAGAWADTPGSGFVYAMPLSGSSSNDYFPLLSTLSNGTHYYYARGNGGTSRFISMTNGTFVNGTWYHLAVTSSGSDTKFYVNATLKGTKTDAPDTMTLSRLGGVTGLFVDGNMDEIALWDSELSAAQITNIYRGEENGGSGGTNGTPGDLSTFNAASGTGPLHWWRFGDGTGDVNSSGGTPANTGVIGTLVDQGSGGKNAANTTGSAQPSFSNVLPA